MPLYREWNSDPYSLAAIWQIAEPESFFLDRTGIAPEMKNEKRRLEHLAGRFLLLHLERDFPLLDIRPDEHDKPRLSDNRFYFSISHSFPYVAAVVSPYVECGIDIQVWHGRMLQLQHKFLAPNEQIFFKDDPKLITLAWSAKEAVYKWQGRRGVDFIEHLGIKSLSEDFPDYRLTCHASLSHQDTLVSINAILDHEFACAWVYNQPGR